MRELEKGIIFPAPFLLLPLFLLSLLFLPPLLLLLPPLPPPFPFPFPLSLYPSLPLLSFLLLLQILFCKFYLMHNPLYFLHLLLLARCIIILFLLLPPLIFLFLLPLPPLPLFFEWLIRNHFLHGLPPRNC